MSGRVPRVVINFKTYAEASGDRAVALAEAVAAVSETSGIAFAIAPQALDVRLVVDKHVPVYAQHFDRAVGSQNTGWISLERLVEAGVVGTLINHSEHPVAAADVQALVKAADAQGVFSIVCAKDAIASGALARFSPDAVAVEPPELIGGDVSVTTADPEIIARSVQAVRAASKRLPLLCGAGVKTRRDVEKAIELGAHGILLASGVTRAKDPQAVLEELAQGFA